MSDEQQAYYGDPAEIAAACINLAILTGNFGKPGGGVASPRGPANAQGVTDMGAHPALLPGRLGIESADFRSRFESTWLSRWGEKPPSSNGFMPVRAIPSRPGLGIAELPEAIASGKIKAMIVSNTFGGRFAALDPALVSALEHLEFLVVTDAYADTPLSRIADVVLPTAMYIEKDGTFTSFDRVVQRVRTAVPPMGEAKNGLEIFSALAQRLGYVMPYRNSAQVMDEITRAVPGYTGITYARLERQGVATPTTSYADAGTSILAPGAGITPKLTLAGALR
jgi:predicted molibdopterin-dependent oxidoreductase YjgC